MKYVYIPFLAWFVAGCCKFCINYLRFGKKAYQLIGYGGFPSTHTTIISSVIFLCGFTEGFTTPYFSLGLGVLLIIIIDAHGLRRKIGQQAEVINILQNYNKIDSPIYLRERMGHSWLEIIGGIFLGAFIAFIVKIL